MRKTVWCADRDSNEIWGINILSAVADIRSELQITEDEAKGRLMQSTIDNPVTLEKSNVDFWVEEGK